MEYYITCFDLDFFRITLTNHGDTHYEIKIERITSNKGLVTTRSG